MNAPFEPLPNHYDWKKFVVGKISRIQKYGDPSSI